MVLVFPDQAHHVKVMTVSISSWKKPLVTIETTQITSSLKGEIDNYLPIAPLRKQPFPVQLQLQTHLTTDRGQTAVSIPTLDRYSYLKINESYDIPIQILNQAYDDDDVPLKILTKGKGGVGELRCYLRRRERACAQQACEQMMDQLSLEEWGDIIGRASNPHILQIFGAAK